MASTATTRGPVQAGPLTNYELGWKTTWLDNTLRLNGAIFHEEWDDIQYSFLPPGGSGLTVIRNAGAAVIDGIEADLTWAPTDALTLSGGFSWLDAKLDEDYVPGAMTIRLIYGRPSRATGCRSRRNSRRTSRAVMNFRWATMNGHLQAAVVYNGDAYSDLTRADRETLRREPGVHDRRSLGRACGGAGLRSNCTSTTLSTNWPATRRSPVASRHVCGVAAVLRAEPAPHDRAEVQPGVLRGARGRHPSQGSKGGRASVRPFLFRFVKCDGAGMPGTMG